MLGLKKKKIKEGGKMAKKGEKSGEKKGLFC